MPSILKISNLPNIRRSWNTLNIERFGCIILYIISKKIPLTTSRAVTYQSTLIFLYLNKKSETVPPNPHKQAPTMASIIPFKRKAE